MADTVLKEITAPYNFVPLSAKVARPEGEDRARGAQDLLEGAAAYSGTLEVTLHTESPVFIGGKKETGKEVAPYKHPDGSLAVPGSTLRGMIRNVVEIATFGQMEERVNSHRYAVRDLQNRKLYGDHMAALAPLGPGGKSIPYPFVCAAMLRAPSDEELRVAGVERADYPALLEVRSFAKIHYDHLIRIAGAGYRPGNKQSAPDKYASWKLGLDITVEVKTIAGHGKVVNKRTRHGDYGLVERASLNGSEKTPARLVFTGQPSQWDPNRPKRLGAGNPKQNDFVFYGQHDTLLVDAETVAAFEFIHSDRGQQNATTSDPNPELRHLLKMAGARKMRQLLKEEKASIPVFFLAEEPNQAVKVNRGVKVRAIGLAMMFRLASKYSVTDAVRHHQKAVERDDFADRMFGYVSTTDKAKRTSERVERKGRVWFEDAIPRATPALGKPVKAILSAPKASFYPSYVQQGGAPDDRPRDKDSYLTWQDQSAVPRGWKRYPARTDLEVPYIPGMVKDLDKVASTFTPWMAPKGLSFKLRFHNLSAVELGAVLWALDFGGDKEARHGLGMGKALGYGRVRLEVTGGHVRDTQDWEHPREGAGLSALRQEAVRAFAAYMEEQLPGEGWAASRQIFELLACAHPSPGQRHLRIDDQRNGNEFIAAKKGGAILAPRGKPLEWTKVKGTLQAEANRERELIARARAGAVIAALQDDGVPPLERVRAWAAKKSPDLAKAQLRKWLGFPASVESDTALEAVDPMTATLAVGAVRYLMAVGGLSERNRLAAERSKRLTELLAVSQTAAPAPVTESAQPKGPARFTESLPDWRGQPEKKLKDLRAKWADRVAKTALWSPEDRHRVATHLRDQGAPDGQINGFWRTQAGLASLSVEQLMEEGR